MSQTIYLVSGANRGIGLSLVKELAKHPEIVVYAGARDPSKASELQQLASEHPDRVHVVKLVSADEANNKAVAKEIQSKYGRVDVVVANAGISNTMGPAVEIPVDQVREHFEVNFTGPLVLFQATYSLLKASKTPKFIPISTGGASSAFASFALGYGCYSSSKAALNFLSQTIHYENDWLVCFPLAPGIVDTDMSRANRKMDKSGKLAALQDARGTTAEQCAIQTFDLLSKATREEHGGKFMQVDGSTLVY